MDKFIDRISDHAQKLLWLLIFTLFLVAAWLFMVPEQHDNAALLLAVAISSAATNLDVTGRTYWLVHSAAHATAFAVLAVFKGIVFAAILVGFFIIVDMGLDWLKRVLLRKIE